MRPTLWLVVLVFSRTIAADSVLGELIQAGMKQKTMRLGGTFSESNIERLARAELKKRPRVNFIKLTIFGEKAGTPLPKPDHVSYDSWKGLYELAARSSNEIAEMISIGDNAVLRVRESNGKVTSKMLTGTNPLEVMISGDLYQIVYLALSPPGQYIAQGASIYVRTTAPLNTENGLVLLRKLGAAFSAVEISVAIRNDAWFIYEPGYPFLNPFNKDLSPPAADEYNDTRTLTCSQWSGPPSCTLR